MRQELRTNGGDTLALGGSTNASFNASAIDSALPGTYTAAQFVGFNGLVKQDTSTWTLNGANSDALPIAVNGGELDVAGQVSTSTLAVQSGGSVVVDGALHIANAGNIGTGAITVDAGGALGLAGNGTTTFGGNVANAGTLAIASGSAAQFNGTYSGPGSVTGAGTAQFDGTLAPGDPVIENFAGNVVLQSANNLLLDLAGTTAGTGYDQLIVGGNAALGGNLTVDLLNNFTPTLGDSFQLISSSTFSGKFGTFNLPTLSQGLQWNTSSLDTHGLLSVQGTAIPEPTTLLLLMPVGVLMLLRRRRPRPAA